MVEMETVWEKPQLRQKILNQFGNSAGMCCQFYHFGEKIFCFSDNIGELTAEITDCSCSLEQWYQVIYESDRRRLQRYVDGLFHRTEEKYNFNYRLRNRKGQLVWVTSKGKCTFDEEGHPKYFLGFLVVPKERQDDDEKTRQAAFLQELNALHSQGEDGYLLMVNVDDLSQINLKYGREFGDGILRNLENSMGSAQSRFSRPFRNGHSSFCTLVTGTHREIVESYFRTLQQDMQAQCTLSRGCVSLQEFQVPSSELLVHYASSALDTAKLNGKNRLVFFHPEDYERRLAEIELQAELEEAVKENFSGFSLRYQPQVRSETFELAGAEALVRFHSPRRGMVLPAEFVPILERSGLMIPVGSWVLRTALAQCRVWREKLPSFRISVNMSYTQLRCPEIQAEVLSELRENDLPGSALTIEVTEGIELQEYGYLNAIFSAWKKEGIEISVDDFGTGYSSLGWLKKLEIDEIKIDRCFISGIQHSVYNLRLVSNIIEVAKSGFLRVCCEGVETMEELAALETLQPALYQGFYFSKPVPPEHFALNSLMQRFKEQCQ
ncbi:EAL domain-containing protein [Anaerotignum lactatifermentans]|uniref:EAL domain-containing protein n=2 Tax=Anaerotignum lactatifermentans TaxID=160404 RepID=A0ABS2G8S7_9FIRM|nr:EAL domain-containing protein [Anaerotignum lactatifermentans]MBM6877582.1 EAL domain-containing protein [Anaerotignum lactatifermentans]